VQRQPDPLQPDDQHELHAAPGDGHHQAGDAARGEGPDAEQAELEHRLGDPGLDHREQGEQRDPAEQQAEDRLDQPVPHDHPQQVADVARGQRVQVDPAEDGGQCDDDDSSRPGWP
jgi:hypothetical protein